MTRWQYLETWINSHGMANQNFTCYSLAASLGITTQEASELIQAYQAAQSGGFAQTSFVIHRIGRTRNAVWHVGVRRADAIGLSLQEANDMRCRVDRFVAPSLRRIGVLNPRALPATQVAETSMYFNLDHLDNLLAAIP